MYLLVRTVNFYAYLEDFIIDVKIHHDHGVKECSISHCIAVALNRSFTDYNVVIDDCSARCACKHLSAPHQK